MSNIRLLNLRNELSNLPEQSYPNDSWPQVEAWVAKARPFFRTQLKEYFADFEIVTVQPKRPRLAGVVSEAFQRQKWHARKRTVDDAVGKILSFLDSIMELQADSADTLNNSDTETYTGGGAFVHDNVSTGRDFIGRDKIEHHWHIYQSTTQSLVGQRTWVVDQMNRGDFTTISDAIKAAKPGDKIVIRRGVYNETLMLDKPLELEGENGPSGVMVQTIEPDTLLFLTTTGQVRNLTLRHLSGERIGHCVKILQGHLLLENCEISSKSLSAILICNHANPTIYNNRIHDSVNGILVNQQGQGVIESNDIIANAAFGITIFTGGNPTLRNNRIKQNGHSAIWIVEGGGRFENNDLRDNQRGAWEISKSCLPNITRLGNLE